MSGEARSIFLDNVSRTTPRALIESIVLERIGSRLKAMHEKRDSIKVMLATAEQAKLMVDGGDFSVEDEDGPREIRVRDWVTEVHALEPNKLFDSLRSALRALDKDFNNGMAHIESELESACHALNSGKGRFFPDAPLLDDPESPYTATHELRLLQGRASLRAKSRERAQMSTAGTQTERLKTEPPAQKWAEKLAAPRHGHRRSRHRALLRRRRPRQFGHRAPGDLRGHWPC